MAKKQVIVNEEMIRGIMAGDIPNYGKDISVDDVMATDESDRNECEVDSPEPVPVEKSTGRQKNGRTVRIRTASSSLWEGMSCKGSRLISVSTITNSYRSFYRL